MKKLFVDTSFLVAFFNKGDAHHLDAREWVQDEEKSIFVITDYIFNEFLTVLLARRNKDLSVRAGETILSDPNIRLLRINDEVFEKAWTVYRMYEDKEWSLTDCTSYVLMKTLLIDTALSFDEHFHQFGFRVFP